ncbi:unnamed protein product, partial [Ascophyllum nodosum]
THSEHTCTVLESFFFPTSIKKVALSGLQSQGTSFTSSEGNKQSTHSNSAEDCCWYRCSSFLRYRGGKTVPGSSWYRISTLYQYPVLHFLYVRSTNLDSLLV